MIITGKIEIVNRKKKTLYIIKKKREKSEEFLNKS